MADADALCGLPEDVLNKGIIQASASGSITQTRKARLVCQPFCVVAGQLVRTLACGSSCDISTRAWRSFPTADGLVIEFTELDDHPQLNDLLDRIPAGRIKRITLSFDGQRFQANGGDMYLWWAQRKSSSPWSARAAAAILVAESTNLLREVDIDGAIKATDAARLINGLPLLEVAKLLVSEADGVWSFRGGRQLKVLKLTFTRGQLIVDMACIAACTLLEELTLLEVDFRNWPALASMARLHYLDVSHSDLPEEEEADCMKPVAQLASLQHLVAGEWDLEPADWQQLAGMTQLTQLQCSTLKVLQASPSSSSMTHFTGAFMVCDPQDDEEEVCPARVPAGAVAALLPELQEACCGTNSGDWQNYMDVARMLAGASKLRSLRLGSRPDFENIWKTETWPAGTLSSMPCLEEFQLGNTELVDVDGLLADAAGCSRLRSFELRCLDSPGRLVLTYSGAGLQALATGACSSSLEHVVVQSRDVPAPVEAAVPLLPLPQLQRAELSLGWSGPALPPDDKDVWAAAVGEELGALLLAAGSSVSIVQRGAAERHCGIGESDMRVYDSILFRRPCSVWRPVICLLEFEVDGTALVCCAVRETQRRQAPSKQV